MKVCLAWGSEEGEPTVSAEENKTMLRRLLEAINLEEWEGAGHPLEGERIG